MPLSALETLRMSPHFAAADLFLVAPLSSAASVFHGVRKATIYYLLVPAVCLAGIAFVFLAQNGWQALLLAVPGLIVIPTMSLLPGLGDTYLPLSRPAARGDQSSRNIVLMLLSMIGMVAAAGVTYLAWILGFLWELVAGELLLVSLANWIICRVIRNRQFGRAD